jgi:N-acetylglucosamine-6-sulfatase
MSARRTAGVVAALVGSLMAGTPPEAAQPHAPAAPAPGSPNIVLVLMDDASLDLVPTMLGAAQMAAQGASYESAYVVDSLCCVSRTNILTGQYPHQTGVRTNVANDLRAPVGGWTAFARYGNGRRAVNAHLHRAGYTTGFVGKFLNEYTPPHGRPAPVPPGWTEFTPLLDSAYDEWDFDWGRSVDGSRLSRRHYGAPPAGASQARKDAAYAGMFIQRKALGFIGRHAGDAAPYFLEVAVFAPHSKTPLKTFYRDSPIFPAMFRDRPSTALPDGNCGNLDCTSLAATALPGYDDPRDDNVPRRTDGSRAPTWQDGVLLPRHRARHLLRDRARMVQAVDRLLRRLLAAVDDNTYVIFTSDNGLHLNQWGLAFGKGTAYGSDTHVPLLVVGPGVVPGVRAGMVVNLDIAPTIEQLAGLTVPDFRSGISFADSLTDPSDTDGRYVFFEHTWSGLSARDPDSGDRELALIPSYVAVRSSAGLLIRYDYDEASGKASYAWELYDLRAGTEEATNVYADPESAALREELATRLEEFLDCRGFTRSEAVPDRCRAITR